MSLVQSVSALTHLIALFFVLSLTVLPPASVFIF